MSADVERNDVKCYNTVDEINTHSETLHLKTVCTYRLQYSTVFVELFKSVKPVKDGIAK